MEEVENKVAEHNEQEVTKEKELAKKIAELAVKKRGIFAYLVRELYVAIKEDLTGGQEEQAKEDFFCGRYCGCGAENQRRTRRHLQRN